MKHIHKAIDYCICDLLADTPDEKCEIHGWGTYPAQCVICGQFFRRASPNLSRNILGMENK